MEDLYTRNGRPLQLVGEGVFSRSGHYLGILRNGKVFDPSGRYCGTVVGDRVVYRTVDSAPVIAPSAEADREVLDRPNRPKSGVWGMEPAFVD